MYVNHLVLTSVMDYDRRSSQFNILEVMGAIYAASLLIGIIMSTTVQPMIGTERAVFYREHAAGTYAAVPYAVSQVHRSASQQVPPSKSETLGIDSLNKEWRLYVLAKISKILSLDFIARALAECRF